MAKYQTGDPVILKNAKGLKSVGLHKNMEGVCAGIVDVEGDQEYATFQPSGVMKFYVIAADRLVLDEDRAKELSD